MAKLKWAPNPPPIMGALFMFFVGLYAWSNPLSHRRYAPGADGRLSKEGVRAIIETTVRREGWARSVPIERALKIAWVESHFDPVAHRYEAHIDDASTGLMQTLHGTARWLQTDMGYRRFDAPDKFALFDPEVSVYFGCAYLDWLANYRNVTRSEDWVVQSYNSGPGNTSLAYLTKFRRAAAELGL